MLQETVVEMLVEEMSHTRGTIRTQLRHEIEAGVSGVDNTVAHILKVHGVITMHQIQSALRRVHLGTYGTCMDCGDQISAKRLEAQPWAERCVSCQKETEQAPRTLH